MAQDGVNYPECLLVGGHHLVNAFSGGWLSTSRPAELA